MGAVSSAGSADSSALNFAESYRVNMVIGDRRSGNVAAVHNSQGGSIDFADAFDN